MQKNDTGYSASHLYQKNNKGFAIYMVGFSLLFALAFTLAALKENSHPTTAVDFDHFWLAVGGALTSLVAAIAFLFVYFAINSIQKSRLENTKKLQANEVWPMVYTERSVGK
ncbi:hypothetical protein KBD68_04690 [Candidatus Woesebacteria bacterium]|nr:hypothetical protein [Candidatus Woesebacteria bacterium]